nr:hypothetical protein [Tanacetum cinerariifolium]
MSWKRGLFVRLSVIGVDMMQDMLY